MSATQNPTGLQLQGVYGNGPYSGETIDYPLTTNNTVSIAVGDLVGLVAGSIVAVTANPAAGTLSVNSPVGVVVGFTYTNPSSGTFNPTTILPANAVTNGYTNIQVKVATWQFERFTVQANGSIPSTAIGTTIGMGGFNADNAQFRVSRLFADVATLTTTGGTQPFRILGFDKTVGNAPGDAFTQILVGFNANTHYFAQVGAH